MIMLFFLPAAIESRAYSTVLHAVGSPRTRTSTSGPEK
jgi:hypothetical protein